MLLFGMSGPVFPAKPFAYACTLKVAANESVKVNGTSRPGPVLVSVKEDDEIVFPMNSASEVDDPQGEIIRPHGRPGCDFYLRTQMIVGSEAIDGAEIKSGGLEVSAPDGNLTVIVDLHTQLFEIFFFYPRTGSGGRKIAIRTHNTTTAAHGTDFWVDQVNSTSDRIYNRAGEAPIDVWDAAGTTKKATLSGSGVSQPVSSS